MKRLLTQEDLNFQPTVEISASMEIVTRKGALFDCKILRVRGCLPWKGFNEMAEIIWLAKRNACLGSFTSVGFQESRVWKNEIDSDEETKTKDDQLV